MDYPTTKREDASDELHGHTVPDPYRWLEDSSSDDVRQWIQAQNALVDTALRGAAFDTISGELTANFKVTTFSTPTMRKGRYFFDERLPDQDKSVKYFRDGLDGEPFELYNPNARTDSIATSIDVWSPSRTGKYVAYCISTGGNEMATLHIMNVDTRQVLTEEIPRCRHSSIAWMPDDSGFYYTKNPAEGTVPKNEEHLHSKAYFHALGQDPTSDRLIFGEGRPKEDSLLLSLSADGSQLCVWVTQNLVTNELYIYSAATGSITPLVTGIPAKFHLSFLRDRAIIRTNYKANNSRLLWAPLDRLFAPIDEWSVLLPERDFPLVGLAVTASKLIVEYSENVCSHVYLYDYDGTPTGEVPLAKYSEIVDVSANREDEEFFYGEMSFIFPKRARRYDPDSGTFMVYRTIESPMNPDEYTVRQEWCASKDGTRVPMFIYHRLDVPSGPRPLILYGYGGHGTSTGPAFNRSLAPWLERGGVCAVANVRGGGEFGKIWHELGTKEHKQHSFDDFIATAEHLISKGYTDASHLGIRGGSSGGMLVLSVEMQRPELFRAVYADVPLTDMIRFPMFGIAGRWIHEYGDPRQPEAFAELLRWSPYHNVREGVEYPATLLRTAEHDTRVHPLHTWKMAAKMQSVHSTRPVYCFTETDAGHTSGQSIKRVIDAQALMLSFFFGALQLQI